MLKSTELAIRQKLEAATAHAWQTDDNVKNLEESLKEARQSFGEHRVFYEKSYHQFQVDKNAAVADAAEAAKAAATAASAAAASSE